jgi:hypothetical protein
MREVFDVEQAARGGAYRTTWKRVEELEKEVNRLRLSVRYMAFAGLAMLVVAGGIILGHVS